MPFHLKSLWPEAIPERLPSPIHARPEQTRRFVSGFQPPRNPSCSSFALRRTSFAACTSRSIYRHSFDRAIHIIRVGNFSGLQSSRLPRRAPRPLKPLGPTSSRLGIRFIFTISITSHSVAGDERPQSCIPPCTCWAAFRRCARYISTHPWHYRGGDHTSPFDFLSEQRRGRPWPHRGQHHSGVLKKCDLADKNKCLRALTRRLSSRLPTLRSTITNPCRQSPSLTLSTPAETVSCPSLPRRADCHQ